MTHIQTAIDDFFFHCRYEKNLTDKTLKAYQIDLSQFVAHLEGERHNQRLLDIDKHVIRRFLKVISEAARPKTIKRKMATLRAFFNYLEFEDRIPVSPFRKLRIKIVQDLKLPEVLTLTEVRRLFGHIYREREFSTPGTASHRTLIRDIAVIEMLFATGMRVSELCGLTHESIDLDEGFVRIWGKGRRERIVPLGAAAVTDALHAYRLSTATRSPDKWFFTNRSGDRLMEQTVRVLIRKHTIAAGLEKNVTPHTFRHTIATLLLENGVDLRYIQYFLGHSTIMTTQLYTKINNRAQREIIMQSHPRNQVPHFL
jgi:integrase/recombinase XerD